MTLEDKILAEEVIDFFKKSDKATLSPGRDIMHLLKDSNTAKRIILPLEKDYGLIERAGKGSFRLTNLGWKFTTFENYEKDSKKTPLNKYQKIYLTFFILFGIFGIYKVFQPSVPISDYQQLKTDFRTLNSKMDSILNSTSNLNTEKSLDSLDSQYLNSYKEE